MSDLMELEESSIGEHLPSLQRMKRDIKAAAETLSDAEARFLVDYYYITQEDRIRAGNQKKALLKSGEPHKAIVWLTDQSRVLENQVKSVLEGYVRGHPVGRWIISQVGLGPVISAGMLAHFDVTKGRTSGAFYRFAGLDYSDAWLGKTAAREIVDRAVPPPTKITESHFPDICAATSRLVPHGGKEGDLKDLPVFTPERLKRFLGDRAVNRENVTAALARRPWNTPLKTLCWKLGESFTKVQNKEDAFYGKVLAERKALEWTRNLSGDFADQAERSLREKNYGSNTEARKWYSGEYVSRKFVEVDEVQTIVGVPPEGNKPGIPMLPPARIQRRAARYATKLFLSHLHTVMWWNEYGEEPPVPYPLAILQHQDYIAPPLFDPADYKK